MVTKDFISDTKTTSEGRASTTPFPAIVTPPLNAEGNSNFSQQTSLNITPEKLNVITNNGKNTLELFQKGIESFLPENKNSISMENSIGGDTGSGTDISTTSITEDTRIVGQQAWNYKVQFFNHAQKPYALDNRAIKQLVIEDDILSWPLRGFIVIDCKEEAWERSFNDIYYHIRSDARDEVYIKIWPPDDSRLGRLSPDVWHIENTYVIFDVQDLPSSNMTDKMKKIYFWDKNFQRIFESNIEWSTATTKTRLYTPLPSEPIEHATDEERSMYTGDAIYSILTEAEVPCDPNEWDKGLGRINYVSKADKTVWECVQDLLQYNTSEKKDDNCVLSWNRFTKKLNYIPYYKLYGLAGKEVPNKLQIEHLFFEEKGEKNPVPSPYKAPYMEDSSSLIDIKTQEFGKILNYKFNQTAGIDNSQAFTTKPVHSHWHLKKQFDIDVKLNEVSKVKNEEFLENYVTKLLGKDYPVFVLNSTKKEHKSTHPEYISHSAGPINKNREERSVLGRGKLLYSGIFLNQCLTVILQGMTCRRSGTFIGIDRISQNSDTDYDWALCGQYFVVNVRHIIQQQKYVTELVLVKVHAYDKLKNYEDVW